MEKKFQQAIREKDQLQKQLDVRNKKLISNIFYLFFFNLTKLKLSF